MLDAVALHPSDDRALRIEDDIGLQRRDRREVVGGEDVEALQVAHAILPVLPGLDVELQVGFLRLWDDELERDLRP